MESGFNAEEVFEMAQQIERNGVAFYTKAASQADDQASRDMLNELANWEHKHEALFKQMRADLSGQEKPFEVDAYSDTARYLQALVSGRIFDLNADPVAWLGDGRSAKDVLSKALEMEKDSILFYLGIRSAVSDPASRDRVDDIINEEMRHVQILSSEMEKLSA